MKKQRYGIGGFVAVLSMAVGVALCGCAEPDSAPMPTAAVTPLGKAVLDWNTASIVLPIYAYGMSSHEIQVVRAASSIVFAKCVTGNTTPTQHVLAEARRALGPIIPDPNLTHWLFGIWDAPFVAAHGWYPFPMDEPPPVLESAGAGITAQCLQESEYLNLLPISNSEFPDGFDAVSRWAGEAYMKTIADSRYDTLLDSLAQCLKDAGYSAMDKTEGGGVYLDPTWNSEQQLAAMLAAAQCNDDLSITEQAANLDAAFQMEYIAQHEAELVTVRAEVDKRLAKAEEILRSAGVM